LREEQKQSSRNQSKGARLGHRRVDRCEEQSAQIIIQVRCCQDLAMIIDVVNNEKVTIDTGLEHSRKVDNALTRDI
jgi:hypothetical protein